MYSRAVRRKTGRCHRKRSPRWRDAAFSAPSSADPARLARDESFWFEVQQAFTVDRSLINLNNGGVSPSPAIVQEAMKRSLDYSNTAPTYSMWRILEPQREGVRQRLAHAFGCDAEEIAVTRNASESLQICQLGFDLEPGDEVLTTDQDYPRMITTFQQRERREGIVLKRFPIPVPAEDPKEIVRLFEERITPRTRLILMCHMINLTGQILPVKQVVAMARRKGIPVIVDGAHAFAHFDFTHDDLDCDYYASSLHKWLFAPHGTGLAASPRCRSRGCRRWRWATGSGRSTGSSRRPSCTSSSKGCASHPASTPRSRSWTASAMPWSAPSASGSPPEPRLQFSRGCNSASYSISMMTGAWSDGVNPSRFFR